MNSKTTAVEIIYHNRMAYIVDLEGKEKPSAEHQRTYSSSNDVWDVYKLSGAHEGPPIEIEIRNAKMGRDDDGWHLEIERWRWVDDKTPFDDDVLCDTYCDAVRDDMKEMFSNQ